MEDGFEFSQPGFARPQILLIVVVFAIVGVVLLAGVIAGRRPILTFVRRGTAEFLEQIRFARPDLEATLGGQGRFAERLPSWLQWGTGFRRLP